MCGITGWVAFDQDLTLKRGLINAMTDTMACRGPDGAGIWSDRHVALGHRRLAVIDLPGGAQPMSVSTPNGEVGCQAVELGAPQDPQTSMGQLVA